MIHEQADCRTCGSPFYRSTDEQWKTLCIECWRSTKAKPHNSATCKACFERGLIAGRKTAVQTTTPTLDGTRIRELLQLAHPDKHGNSKLAARVTAWLLSQRSAA